jgi:hypothetical protein
VQRGLSVHAGFQARLTAAAAATHAVVNTVVVTDAFGTEREAFMQKDYCDHPAGWEVAALTGTVALVLAAPHSCERLDG